MDPYSLQRMRILVVDDDELKVLVLERMLAAAGYKNVQSTRDPSMVARLCRHEPPDLILLDLHMPELSGFEVMATLAKLRLSGPPAPILVVTADNTPDARRLALSYGAIDFVTHPFDRGELELRVRNHLHTRRLALELEAVAGDHELRARRAERELDSARMDVLERLAHAAEFRDDETTLHAWRVGRLSGMIASAVGLSGEECQALDRAARLHDVGKIAIPDEILFKQGPAQPHRMGRCPSPHDGRGADPRRQLLVADAACRNDRSLASRTVGRPGLPGRPTRSGDPAARPDRGARRRL